MSSENDYLPSELPITVHPRGTQWLADRLASVGYTGCFVYKKPPGDKITIVVDQDNVSKAQLLFDMTHSLQHLTASETSLNVAPGSTHELKIYGPADANVFVTFKGVGFVNKTRFQIPQGGVYNFQLGPCPSSQRVVEPQLYLFSTEGTDISPVAVSATFM